MPSREDVAWLAGLLEGEGCFWFGDNGRILIRLAMTDQDIVEKAARLMDGALDKPVQPRGSRRRIVYAMRVRGAASIKWMGVLKPLMGSRRQAKIDECLAYAASRPGKRYNSCGGKDRPRRGVYGLAHPQIATVIQ